MQPKLPHQKGYVTTDIQAAVQASKNQSINMPKSIYFIALLSLIIATVFFIHNILNQDNNRTSTALDASREIIETKTQQFAISVRRIEKMVTLLANDIESGRLGFSNTKPINPENIPLEKRLISDLNKNKWMHGLGIAFEPYAVFPQQRLWSKYFVVGADNNVTKKIIDYDYTKPEHAWYHKPRLEGNLWNEPFSDRVTQSLIEEFSTPFWLPGKNKLSDKPSGVIFGNISFHKLKQLIHFDYNHIAYYFLLSKSGRYILHPDEALVLSGKTIFERALEKKDTILNTMATQAIKGERGFISHIDPLTHDKSWMIYNPLNELGWSLVTVIDKNRLINHDDVRRYWFSMVTLFLLCSIFITAILVFCRPTFKKHLLSISCGLAFLIICGVASLWKVAETYPLHSKTAELKVMSQNILNDFKNKQKEAARTHFINSPHFIKTGVYLQSVQFEGANNIKVSGYVWQHYRKGDHKGIPRGFVLPEAETPTINRVYHKMLEPLSTNCSPEKVDNRDCDELIGWYVFATLRQEFDYSLYPLDSQQIWLRLWHKAFQDNVILVPDVESYSLPNPVLTPGIQDGFVLPGWDIKESWFSFNNRAFNTNFGSMNAHGLNDKPELLFNLSVRRKFMDPFVSRIIPVMVIFILMFLFILICTKSGKMAKWLDFSASSVVLGLSALFFVIGINHSELRQSLNSSNIMYFEHFYFIAYIMILYVAINSISIAKQKVVDGQDENFISKILYWPALSLVLYSVTFWAFY